jgi:hypothetical protein
VVGGIVYGYLGLWGSVSLGIANKKVWDWLDLVIVPTALAIAVYELNRAQQERERQAQEDRSERERKAEVAQKERELEVERQRAQDDALQAYLDQMAQLLLDKKLRNSEEDSEVRTVARARTVTVLPRLDGGRKRSIVLFLYEARLITRGGGYRSQRGRPAQGGLRVGLP